MKILLWGGKSKARIAMSMLEEAGHEVSFIFDPFLKDVSFETRARFGYTRDHLKEFVGQSTHFIVCIGGDHGLSRVKISDFLSQKFGLHSLSLLSPLSHIDKTSETGSGLQIMPGAIIHKFCSIGDYTVINTNATVDHECILGRGVHIMGAAAVAGCVRIGDYAAVGTNATILPHLTIGEGAIIGAGAVVTKNIPAGQVVAGVPAREIRENHPQIDLTILEDCLETL